MTSRTNEKFGHYAYLETGLVAPPFYRKDGIMYVNKMIYFQLRISLQRYCLSFRRKEEKVPLLRIGEEKNLEFHALLQTSSPGCNRPSSLNPCRNQPLPTSFITQLILGFEPAVYNGHTLGPVGYEKTED
jgi:hypothetical protein